MAKLHEAVLSKPELRRVPLPNFPSAPGQPTPAGSIITSSLMRTPIICCVCTKSTRVTTTQAMSRVGLNPLCSRCVETVGAHFPHLFGSP